MRYIVAWEGDSTGLRTTGSRPVTVGQTVDVGREGDLALGVRVPNRGVSRVAATITPTEAGWRIGVRNRNGAVLHPWGQLPQYEARDTLLHWPLVGVRMLHEGDETQHWVLLVADDLSVTPAGPDPSMAGATNTDRVGRPGELPPAERAALLTIFEELLAWPPRHPAVPLQLKQVATRLGISVSGVQERLNAARRRAERLGNRSVSPTDPSYLFALVRGGYLPLPRSSEQVS